MTINVAGLGAFASPFLLRLCREGKKEVKKKTTQTSRICSRWREMNGEVEKKSGNELIMHASAENRERE